MGILTVSACGVSTALICDRLAAIVDLFNPNQVATGINHFLIRPPEVATIGLLIFVAFIFFVAAWTNTYPYNLNQMQFTELDTIFKGHSKSHRARREIMLEGAGGDQYYNFKNCTALQQKRENELEQMEHMLIGLVSIDNEECFIRKICQINQDRLRRNFILPQHETLLELIRRQGQRMLNTIYRDIYDEALSEEIQDCNKKYKSCPIKNTIIE